MSPSNVPRSIVSMQLLTRLASEQGMPATDCLWGTGVSAEALADAHTEVLPAQELQLVRNIVARIGYLPALGLAAGARYHLSVYGVWGFALATSPTPRALAQVATRYLDLSFAFIRFSLRFDDGAPCVLMDDTEIPEDVQQFLLERDFAAMVNAMTEVMPGASPFQSVHFRCAEPAYVTQFIELCGLRPQFGMPSNAVFLKPEYLDTVLPQGNELVSRACEDYCRRLLARKRKRVGMSARVRDRLLQSPHKMPDIEALAAELHMAPRSLRRRLQEEGTSFRALTEEVRQALAEEMLKTAKLKLDEIAERLGYAESASFIHAFKRWTGQSPTAFRRAHAR